MTPSDIIQTLAVLAAVGASLVALAIAAKDRKHSARIAGQDREHSAAVADADRAHAASVAAADRAATMHQLRLFSELDAAKRLAVIEARGGHSDPVARKDMGAESLALVAFLGPERVPMMWQRRVGKSDDELRDFAQDENNQQFLRDSVEAERAVHAIIRDIRALEQQG